MKFPLLLIFIKVSNCLINIESQTFYNLSIALNHFVRNVDNVKIISSVSEENKKKSEDFITNFTSKLDSTKVSIGVFKCTSNICDSKDSLVLVLIDSLESFEIVEEKLLMNNSNMDKFYLLILLNGVFTEINEILERFWSYWIYDINILSESDDGNISMFTFFPFSNENCGTEISLTLINQFNPTSRSWTSTALFPDKFDNLNDCPLKIAVLGANVPSVLITTSDSGIENYSGFEVNILKEILEYFNSTFQFEAFEVIGTVFDNGSIVPGMLPNVYKKKFDVALGTLSLQHDRQQFLSATKSFLSVPIIIVTPPAAIISPFQKLIRPFALLVWILILTLFLIGFIVTLTLRKAPKSIYNFVVGEDVRGPFFNMLIAFFGGFQLRLPRRNFARYLLMNFLLFCLVIRCLYQGKLFIILKAELLEKKVETIQDVVDRNMIFYTYESLSKRVQGLKFSDRYYLRKKVSEFYFALKKFL